MKKIFFVPLVIVLSFSCTQANKKILEQAKHVSADSTVSYSEKKIDWLDKLVQNYIAHSENKLIKSERKKDIKWELDDIRNADTAKYYVIHIGHEAFDINNGDTCCYRFSTDAWVYVDSLTTAVYEYDLAKDKLNKWRK